jgi:hypothetical protein
VVVPVYIRALLVWSVVIFYWENPNERAIYDFPSYFLSLANGNPVLVTQHCLGFIRVAIKQFCLIYLSILQVAISFWIKQSLPLYRLCFNLYLPKAPTFALTQEFPAYLALKNCKSIFFSLICFKFGFLVFCFWWYFLLK